MPRKRREHENPGPLVLLVDESEKRFFRRMTILVITNLLGYIITGIILVLLLQFFLKP